MRSKRNRLVRWLTSECFSCVFFYYLIPSATITMIPSKSRSMNITDKARMRFIHKCPQKESNLPRLVLQTSALPLSYKSKLARSSSTFRVPALKVQTRFGALDSQEYCNTLFANATDGTRTRGLFRDRKAGTPNSPTIAKCRLLDSNQYASRQEVLSLSRLPFRQGGDIASVGIEPTLCRGISSVP